MNAIIEYLTDKYYVWHDVDNDEYVLTPKWSRDHCKVELCRGSLEKCEIFMDKHPYGITRSEYQKTQEEKDEI